MRILFLTPFLSWPPDHGGRIRAFQLMAGLAERHAVLNVTGLAERDRGVATDALSEAGIAVTGEPLEPRFGKLTTADRSRKLWDLVRGRSSLLRRFRTGPLADRIRAAAGAGVDACILETAWMGAYLPEVEHLPLIYSSQNVEAAILAERASAEVGKERWLALREARALERFEASLAARSRLVVAVSREDQQQLSRLAPGTRVEVVDNGVDLTVRGLLPPPSFSPLRLLYIGGYDYGPNADAARVLATDVLPRVREVHPDAELVLVGADPAGAVSTLASAAGVSLAGRVAETRPFLEAASVLVVPLRYGGGSRLKILEALAVGRPVVASQAGAAGLAFEDGRHGLVRDGGADLARGVIELAGNLDLAGRVILEGRRLVEQHHDWRPLRQRFRELVEDALGAR